MTTPFKYVCFHVLLDHHRQGIEEAAPNYIVEKLEAFDFLTDEEAWAMLDWRNHARVLDWMARWNVLIDPSFAEQHSQELLAVEKLGLH